MAIDRALLVRVNSEVNLLGYETDQVLYEQPEFWTEIPLGGKGDCEDSAITKLRRLVEAGMDIGSLRLATCNVETGEYHAVLIASLPEGDWMLDNRQPLPVEEWKIKGLGYTPALIQREGGKPGWAAWEH